MGHRSRPLQVPTEGKRWKGRLHATTLRSTSSSSCSPTEQEENSPIVPAQLTSTGAVSTAGAALVAIGLRDACVTAVCCTTSTAASAFAGARVAPAGRPLLGARRPLAGGGLAGGCGTAAGTTFGGAAAGIGSATGLDIHVPTEGSKWAGLSRRGRGGSETFVPTDGSRATSPTLFPDTVAAKAAAGAAAAGASAAGDAVGGNAAGGLASHVPTEGSSAARRGGEAFAAFAVVSGGGGGARCAHGLGRGACHVPTEGSNDQVPTGDTTSATSRRGVAGAPKPRSGCGMSVGGTRAPEGSSAAVADGLGFMAPLPEFALRGARPAAAPLDAIKMGRSMRPWRCICRTAAMAAPATWSPLGVKRPATGTEAEAPEPISAHTRAGWASRVCVEGLETKWA